MHDRHRHREVPPDADIGAECSVTLATFDERGEELEDGEVTAVQLGLWQSRVDRDQRMEPAQCPPRRFHDPLQGLSRGAALGLGRCDNLGHLGNGAVGDRLQ